VVSTVGFAVGLGATTGGDVNGAAAPSCDALVVPAGVASSVAEWVVGGGGVGARSPTKLDDGAGAFTDVGSVTDGIVTGLTAGTAVPGRLMVKNIAAITAARMINTMAGLNLSRMASAALFEGIRVSVESTAGSGVTPIVAGIGALGSAGPGAAAVSSSFSLLRTSALGAIA
jgi:hypothetical protein